MPEGGVWRCESTCFAPSDSAFMIDYAVDPTGRCAWLLDPEGNKVELWEPKRRAGTVLAFRRLR